MTNNGRCIWLTLACRQHSPRTLRLSPLPGRLVSGDEEGVASTGILNPLYTTTHGNHTELIFFFFPSQQHERHSTKTKHSGKDARTAALQSRLTPRTAHTYSLWVGRSGRHAFEDKWVGTMGKSDGGGWWGTGARGGCWRGQRPTISQMHGRHALTHSYWELRSTVHAFR